MSWLLLVTDVLDRDAAREAARRELSRTPYRDAQPPWAYRVLKAVLDRVSEALDRASATVPGGPAGLVLLVLLLGALVAVVLVRLRPSASRSSTAELFGSGAVLTAAAHRARAEAAAAEGRWSDAVRERLRAVARELETRGVLDPRPGRTADELAREAGTAVPALAGLLTHGTRVFDDVWYGGRVADHASYAVLVQLDEQVTAARLVRS